MDMPMCFSSVVHISDILVIRRQKANKRAYELQFYTMSPNKIRIRKKADFFVLFVFHYSIFIIHLPKADFE